MNREFWPCSLLYFTTYIKEKLEILGYFEEALLDKHYSVQDYADSGCFSIEFPSYLDMVLGYEKTLEQGKNIVRTGTYEINQPITGKDEFSPYQFWWTGIKETYIPIASAEIDGREIRQIEYPCLDWDGGTIGNTPWGETKKCTFIKHENDIEVLGDNDLELNREKVLHYKFSKVGRSLRSRYVLGLMSQSEVDLMREIIREDNIDLEALII